MVCRLRFPTLGESSSVTSSRIPAYSLHTYCIQRYITIAATRVLTSLGTSHATASVRRSTTTPAPNHPFPRRPSPKPTRVSNFQTGQPREERRSIKREEKKGELEMHKTTRGQGAGAGAVPAQSPGWLRMYDDFIAKNAGQVSQIESALRSLTYIIPGMSHPLPPSLHPPAPSSRNQADFASQAASATPKSPPRPSTPLSSSSPSTTTPSSRAPRPRPARPPRTPATPASGPPAAPSTGASPSSSRSSATRSSSSRWRRSGAAARGAGGGPWS